MLGKIMLITQRIRLSNFSCKPLWSEYRKSYLVADNLHSLRLKSKHNGYFFVSTLAIS